MKKITLLAISLLTFLFDKAQITIHPGDNIQLAVDSNPAGTSFTLTSGLYRLQDVTPKSNDLFIGESGAIMNGSTLLQNWIFNGNYWVIGGQTQQGQIHGACMTGNPGCIFPEDLYMDDKPLRHDSSLVTLGTGAWYFDYAHDSIYMTDDPTSHKMEISTARRAFGGSADYVTVKNIIVEKYAIPAQMGAIGDQYPGRNWVIENNEVRLNHGAGINALDTALIKGNYVHDNGQKGIGINGAGGLIENNEISSNNFAGFDHGWDAGGIKFAVTSYLTVRNNYVHDNAGPGIWSDVYTIYTTYESNRVEDNSDAGIFHEISYDAIIRCNTVKRNGRGYDVWASGSQIQVAASRNVQIYNNTVEVAADAGNGITLIQQNRDTGTYGACLVINDTIHDNEIFYLGNHGFSGAVQDWFGNPDFYSSNYFYKNIYHAPDTTQGRWSWSDKYMDWNEFSKTGQELNGSADTNVHSAPIVFTGCNGIPLEIKQIKKTSAISVYPNPFSDHSTLLISSGTSGICHIQITDLAGRLIYSTSASVTANIESEILLSLENYKSGLYLLSVENNNTVSRMKLLKK